MIASLLAAAALLVQSASAPAGALWTWTLYDGDGPVVLANEVPDTAYLKSTLECDPGSGVARLSLYEVGAEGGFVSLTAGDASATVEAGPSRGGVLKLALRTDHPVFAAFATTGVLDLSIAGTRRTIEVQRPHLAKLRRFAEACGS